MDPLTLTLIAGGVTTGVNLLTGSRQNKQNIEFQETQNREDREFQKYMYQLQRAHALIDWNRQNKYDSPEQQMIRLQQAGLNPHLVYGKGAENTSSMIRSSSPDGGSQPAPKSDLSYARAAGAQLMDSMAQAYQMKQVQAQTDNLYEQNQLLKAQTVKTLTEGQKGSFDLDLAKDLRDTTIEQARRSLDKTGAEISQIEASTAYTLSENERRALESSTNVAKTLADIARQRMETAKTKVDRDRALVLLEISKHDKVVAKFAADLAAQGINPNDPTWLRMLIDLMLDSGVLGEDSSINPSKINWDKLMEMQKRGGHNVGGKW